MVDIKLINYVCDVVKRLNEYEEGVWSVKFEDEHWNGIVVHTSYGDGRHIEQSYTEDEVISYRGALSVLLSSRASSMLNS